MFEPQLRKKSRWASKFADKSFWDFDGSQKFLLSRLWRDPLRCKRQFLAKPSPIFKEV
jgi:hypothetical protein